MLEIIYTLEPFFEDCYRKISVREYSRIIKKSPPTASKLLESYFKEGILNKEEYRNYIFYYSNRENKLFVDFLRIYWKIKLKKLIKYIEEIYLEPTIILFGPLSKAEVVPNSDLDIAILSAEKKNLKLERFERLIGRQIQVFDYKSIEKIRNDELKNNIVNGVILKGEIMLK